MRDVKYSKSLLVWMCLFVSGNGFAADQPNILLIVSEDNGPELACYGDRYARTPHLDRLADDSILFSRAFVPQAGCSQSRASFLTGLYPHQHGQIGLATWGFRLYRKDTPNLPRSLKEIGYRAGLIGKLHINPASAFPFDMHEIAGANFQRKDLGDYSRHAKEFMNAGEEPFFLSVNYPDAHDPWIRQVDGLPKNPQTKDDVQIMDYMGIDSPEFREMVADYYNCMSRLDSLIGDLLRELEQSGKADNTIVIYIGDHGADMLRGKRTCYEGGLRIPMLVKWPGRIVPQVRDEFVSTLDLMPTLLKASGANDVAGLPGAKLQPLFQAGSAKWRTHFFAEYHTHAAAPNYFPQRSVRGERYKLIESLLPDAIHPDYAKTIEKLHGDFTKQKYSGTLDLNAVIASARPAAKAAYALMRKPPRYQLYDLDQDPHEFKNLAADPRHAATLSELKQRLAKWRTETNDPLLHESNLARLSREVQSMKKKSAARKHNWKYPQYLLEANE
ncbi:sulfatase [bacterium]|nr:sulfatase [bacterium]